MVVEEPEEGVYLCAQCSTAEPSEEIAPTERGQIDDRQARHLTETA